MRILVIDDQRIFNSFPSLPELGMGDMVVHCDTSQLGLQSLYDGDWDEVYLDHDMGMESDMSGTDMVDYIESEQTFSDIFLEVGKFYIHTMNPTGGEYMMRVLKKLGYEVERLDPTPYLDFDAMYNEGRNPWLAGPKR